MAIAGVIGAAAVGVGMTMHRGMADLRRRVTAWDEAKRLEEYLLSTVMEAGGEPLSLSQAIQVVNGHTTTSDMLIVRRVSSERVCRVFKANGANLVLGANGCTCPSIASFGGQRVMFVPDAGDPFMLTLGASPSNATGECSMPVPGGGSLPLRSGFIADVETMRIFMRVDPSHSTAPDRQLISWYDTDEDNVVDDNEIAIIADRVFSFQVALGYDVNGDGHVQDNDSASDEWLFNAAGDTPSSMPDDALRMVGIAVIVGTPSTAFLRSEQLYDGAAVNGANVSGTGEKRYLVPAQSKVVLRNRNVFLP